MTAKVGSRGVVYAAFGSPYLDECSVSVESLVRASPSLPYCTFTDEPRSWEARKWKREQVILLDRGNLGGGAWSHLTGSKIEAIARSPFEQTLFLDTDTVVLGDVDPLFGLLERFDVGASYCTPWYGQTTTKSLEISSVPLVFPEYNTGVILLNMANQRTVDFVEMWREIFIKDSTDELTRSSDQQAFRIALWKSTVRIVTLRRNFNYWGHELEHMPIVVAHKILNKHQTFFPAAAPEDLAKSISTSLTEDEAWTLLVSISRDGRMPEALERLKKFDFAHLRYALNSAPPVDEAEDQRSALPRNVLLVAEQLRQRYDGKISASSHGFRSRLTRAVTRHLSRFRIGQK
jgi:hypothetical protein